MSLHGHLDLLAAADTAGRTVLRRQSFAAPIHISKPHRDAGWLVVNLASPAPGLLAGDRVNVRVDVESGARLMLTAPSANRIHAMPAGHAELTQSFRVASGAALDVWPEYLIPQAGARYRQRTRIEVAPGGSLLWTETIAPGRAAAGEIFAFTELRIATDLHIGSIHALRERYVLTLGDALQRALLRQFATPYYASVLCVSPCLAAANDAVPRIAASCQGDGVLLGVSRLAADAWAVKIVAGSSPDLRQAVAVVRAQLCTALEITSPSLRRVTGESLPLPRPPGCVTSDVDADDRVSATSPAPTTAVV